LKDAKILVLGVAFKRDVDDLRHSPALKVMELLTEDGATNLDFVDPFVPELRLGETTMNAVPFSDEIVAGADLVLITTDHSAFDYDAVVRHAKLVIDTRNATKDVTEGREKIRLLGGGA
jgi:UDP-N-acetyl-D-glucosamine dehydrogenase